MPQLYYWDLDGTLVNRFVRNNIAGAIKAVQFNHSDLDSSSRDFSLKVMAKLEKIARNNNIQKLDILLNKAKLIPLFKSIINAGEKIRVLWSPIYDNERYSDYANNSLIFHICNAYVDNFIADQHLIELPNKKSNSFFPDADSDSSSENTHYNARSLAYLIEELQHKPRREMSDNNDPTTLNRRWYNNRYSEQFPACSFIIKNISGQELLIGLDAKTFLKQWAHVKRPYGECYADDGEQFLIVLEDLFKQGFKVNFDESILIAFGFSIEYPDGWIATTEINAGDLSIVNDEPRFLQFFEVLGCKTYIANTGEAKKNQLFNSCENFSKIQYLSESRMEKMYKDEKLNSFIDNIIMDNKNVQENNQAPILYAKGMPAPENYMHTDEDNATDEVEIDINEIPDSGSESKNTSQDSSFLSCLSNVSLCDVGVVVLTSVCGAAALGMIGAGLGGLGEEYVKTAIQAMGIGETASNTLFKYIAIGGGGAVGAFLGGSGTAVYNCLFFRAPAKVKTEEKENLIAQRDDLSLKTFTSGNR